MTAPAAVMREYLPCPELRPYVCSYLWITFEGEEPERTIVRVLPDGAQETRFNLTDPLLNRMIAGGQPSITFFFGDPWKIRNGRRTAPALRTSCVVGATTRAGTVEFGRRADALGVLFRASVAHVFLRVPADSLTDEIVPLDDVWGPVARTLEARLAEPRTAAERIHALEKELLRRLRAARWIDTGLQPITKLIESERGAVAVEWLSRASGMSRQHLARKFREQVGVTPKQFCRFARFNALMSHVYQTAQANWATAAAEFGYYD
jgi:AraC-like DNA-binding protein